jgi:NADH:ubiquinone oxidoreductase subunit 6 (subunit J)
MTAALILIALVMLGSAAVAMMLRNLIYSALLLILSWAGIAAFYLWAGAEFAAFAQVLVYVGAISMVVLFAVLLTRQGPAAAMLVEPASRRRGAAAIAVGACVAAVIGAAILSSEFRPPANAAPSATVRQIGWELMNKYGAALLIVGVILTVALIGATILAATESPRPPEDTP